MMHEKGRMTKRSKPNSSVRYHKLSGADDGFVDMQFRKPETKVPWKGIFMAMFLFMTGTVLICISSLMFTGHISAKHSEGAWPLMILGILMFIPGAYHVQIAYYAFRGYPGYVFEDIPDFD